MDNFRFRPQVYKFDHFKVFVDAFEIGENDFILTNECIYEPFIRPLNLAADFLFQEKYGIGEPSDEMIHRIIAAKPRKHYKRIIAIGGGTVIDIAKLLVLKRGDKVVDIFERKVPLVKDKELIIVPTTCGTGSEVTNIVIAEIKERQTKMGLVADELYADCAVLIPELLKGLPFKFFISSSIDALIHAIESYVSPKSNGYTELYSAKAIEMILKGYLEILDKGEDYRFEILADFLVASNYAGIAFDNTGVGAVHALSYPLGGKYHVPHGEANYQFFTEVFKNYNRLNPTGKIKEVNKILASILKIAEEKEPYNKLEDVLNELLRKRKLREYGMTEEEIPVFTDRVMATQRRLLANNYIPLTREEILAIYKNLY
ncbi:4-hydroxybutyrate dehydrogenase [Clostridiaceae bacterium 35-E11]